jgi:hypothetical protein
MPFVSGSVYLDDQASIYDGCVGVKGKLRVAIAFALWRYG